MIYPQSNRIVKLEGLGSLLNLEELYISHNGIEEIEGLDSLVSNYYEWCVAITMNVVQLSLQAGALGNWVSQPDPFPRRACSQGTKNLSVLTYESPMFYCMNKRVERPNYNSIGRSIFPSFPYFKTKSMNYNPIWIKSVFVPSLLGFSNFIEYLYGQENETNSISIFWALYRIRLGRQRPYIRIVRLEIVLHLMLEVRFT